MTTTKQLSPVGYLNKMTGHIWTPTEQPDAVDQPGIYEPLVLSREALAVEQQKDALQLSVDNILRGLGITGDGPFSQLMLEKFIALQAKCDALVAENVVLKEATSGHYYWEDGGDGPEEPESFACNTEMKVGEEFELVTGVEIGYTRFRVLNDEYDIDIVNTPLQTPDTDAVIAKIKAQAISNALNSCSQHLDTDCVMESFGISYEEAELRTKGASKLRDALDSVSNALRVGRKG